MRVIIAGGRDIWDADAVCQAIDDSGFKITEIVCGGAPGVDTMGWRYGVWNDILVAHFPADWDTFGKAAGPIRNAEMAQYAEALIAVWDGHSKGTEDMIKQAVTNDLHIHIVILPKAT